jgi:FMN phosphatase YigB (HAD superfamily)
MTPIRALFLDIGNTLIGDPRPAAFERLARTRFDDTLDAQRTRSLVDALRTADETTDALGFSHFLGEEAISERAREIAGDVLGLPPTEAILAAYRRSALAIFDASPDLVPIRGRELLILLGSIRDGGVERIGLLSNERRWAPLIYVERVLRLPAGTFDPILTSDDFGAAKPDARIFAAAAAAVSLPPGACAHVGNSIALDVEPAIAAGMRACLMTRFDGTVDQEMPSGVVAIRDLTDLLAWLAAFRA